MSPGPGTRSPAHSGRVLCAKSAAPLEVSCRGHRVEDPDVHKRQNPANTLLLRFEQGCRLLSIEFERANGVPTAETGSHGDARPRRGAGCAPGSLTESHDSPAEVPLLFRGEEPVCPVGVTPAPRPSAPPLSLPSRPGADPAGSLSFDQSRWL